MTGRVQCGMSDRDALLEAVFSNPADDAPRLVYADWLDEHGEPAQAAFIRAQVELARTEAKRQGVLDQANTQAAKLIDEGRAAAARVQEHETQKAIAAAQQIMVRAQEASAQERTRILAELKSQFGRLVVETTATVTGKILTAEDQQRLVEETAKQLTA